MDIRLYRLSTTSILKALPRLVEKVFEKGAPILIHATSPKVLKELNTALWTYTPLGFLPHGMQGEGFEAEQPIFLSTEYVSPNKAEVCVAVDPVFPDQLSAFKTVLYLFDDAEFGRYQSMLGDAHISPKDVVLWTQNKDGAWAKGVMEKAPA